MAKQHKIKILAIVGSYRKGGIIDSAISEILAAAREQGAETEKIYLIDKEIEFCTNCRECSQVGGLHRGVCVSEDDMCRILDAVEASNAIVIGSPMNFSTVTAVMKRFIERLVCYAHWPWGAKAPVARKKEKNKPAVVVGSSAAPAIIARLFTQHVKLLKDAAGIMGFSTIGVIFIGLAAQKKRQDIGDRVRKKARRTGEKLVSKCTRA